MRFLLAGNVLAWRNLALGGAVLVALAACENGAGGKGIFKINPESVPGGSLTRSLVGQDIEAPEIFQVADRGLWDGRPSLGGVWVAHPDVTEPERVIIRNTANSRSVIGALFRRERATPGPALQVSSDAAVALGMLAGAPAQLNVTALRREAVTLPESGQPGSEKTGSDENARSLSPELVEASPLEPVAAIYSEPAGPAAMPVSPLDRPYIQLGIFSIQQNAENTAKAMRQAGMTPVVHQQNSQGKTFWRVIVGPAADGAQRAALLQKITSAGFTDAYAVDQ